MADLIYLAIIVGFFALFALYVTACDRIIGPDEVATPERAPEQERIAA